MVELARESRSNTGKMIRKYKFRVACKCSRDICPWYLPIPGGAWELKSYIQNLKLDQRGGLDSGIPHTAETYKGQ